VGYDWVCPLHEVSPEEAAAAAAASAQATSDQELSSQSPSARAPSAGEGAILLPKMSVRRTSGPTRRDWTPPGPSRLRETVEAQGDDKFEKLYRSWERFKVTGKQPPVSVPIDGPQITQYSPSGSSTYRPFSAPPNVTDPMRRDAGQSSSSGTQQLTSRRLGSTELFPDRYRQESRPAVAPTEARDPIVVKTPRPATPDSSPPDDGSIPPCPQLEFDSPRIRAKPNVSDSALPTALDPALSDDASVPPDDAPVHIEDISIPAEDAPVPPYSQSEIDSRRARAKSDGSDSAPPATLDSAPPKAPPVPPYPQSVIDSRRARAKSNASDATSASSTESSRAQRSLAYRLDKGKAGWSPNASKSTASASLSFASFKTGVKTIANTLAPAGGKSEAEDLTRQLSQSPKASGSSARRNDGYETDQDDDSARSASSSRRRSRKTKVTVTELFSFGGDAGRDEGSNTEQGAENARPTSSRRRRSRKNTDAAVLPLELDTSIGRLGILPSPPKPSSPVAEETTDADHVISGGASQNQGPITSEFRALVS
jgi:hypothetical protein